MDHDTTVLKSTPARSAIGPESPHTAHRELSDGESAALKHLRSEVPRYVATAPGRIDVMGGIGEYTGALVLNLPTDRTVSVAVQPRRDRKLVLHTGESRDDGAAPCTLPLDRLFDADGVAPAPSITADLPAPCRGRDARCVVGTVAEMIRAGLIPTDTGGFAVSVVSTFGDTGCLGACAATAAATWTAVAACLGATPDWQDGAELCRRVECDWLGAAVGIADGASALVGRPGAISQLHCDSRTLGEPVPLPARVAIVGVDVGASPPDPARFLRVRAAAAMGKALIQRIVAHEDEPLDGFAGKLAHITGQEFVERFRDRLPTTMTGRDFLKRFGKTDDPLAKIEPGVVYKIRSRTEHHVYENVRSHRFAQLMLRAARVQGDQALIDAGELMYASHWSYGQRCGLGARRAEALVKHIRELGTAAGLFGARVSGRGCGGSISVLIRDAEETRAALRAAIASSAPEDQPTPTLVHATSPGALIVGAVRA